MERIAANDRRTAEKIKNAARTLFVQKGYDGVKTRDIASSAETNVALVHYYFRNKKNLFHIIITEVLGQFMEGLVPLFANKDISIENKIETICGKYIDLLLQFPDLPLFLLSELKSNPSTFDEASGSALGSIRKSIGKSYFFNQVEESIRNGETELPHIAHFISNLMGLTIFPFVARPLLQRIARVGDAEFTQLMQDRKQLIPLWMKTMMKSK